MASNESCLLAVDVGAGTQDVLLYESGQPVENCVKMVLPSPTAIVAGRIRRATAADRDIFLTGNLMGGGPCVGAMADHLKTGLAVYATPLAAKTIRDDLRQVEGMGVRIIEQAPPGVVTIHTRDVDVEALGRSLALFDVELPDRFAVAVQDHGESLDESQRRFRFRHWERFVQTGGRLLDMAYAEAVPGYFTRMIAVRNDVPGALLMDTGAAALWGALCDERVASRRSEGLVVVNVGNQHTVAVLVREERVWGLFEHHTARIDTGKLARYVAALQAGTLTNEEVYDEHGHGALVAPDYPGDGGFAFVAVTGPNRRMAGGLGYYMAAPYGDMMLSGAFGLVAAARRLGLVS